MHKCGTFEAVPKSFHRQNNQPCGQSLRVFGPGSRFSRAGSCFSGAGSCFSGAGSCFSGAGSCFPGAGSCFSGAGSCFSGAGSCFSGASSRFPFLSGHWMKPGRHFAIPRLWSPLPAWSPTSRTALAGTSPSHGQGSPGQHRLPVLFLMRTFCCSS